MNNRYWIAVVSVIAAVFVSGCEATLYAFEEVGYKKRAAKLCQHMVFLPDSEGKHPKVFVDEQMRHDYDLCVHVTARQLEGKSPGIERTNRALRDPSLMSLADQKYCQIQPDEYKCEALYPLHYRVNAYLEALSAGFGVHRQKALLDDVEQTLSSQSVDLNKNLDNIDPVCRFVSMGPVFCEAGGDSFINTTPLGMAADRSWISDDHYADENTRKSGYRTWTVTPLGVIKILLEAGADSNIPDSKGRYPLVCSC